MLMLAAHVTIAPTSLFYIALAVASGAGALHMVIKLGDRLWGRNGRNGKQAATVFDCGLEPSVTKLSESINKLCVVTEARSKLHDQRFDTLDKGLERVETVLRSQA